MIKAVLFDMDGVIFNTERLYSEAVPAIAKDLGYDMDMPFFLKTLGISSHECHKLYAETYGEDFPFQEASDRLFHFILDYNREHTMPLKAHVIESLQELRSLNLQIVLATSSPRQVVNDLFAPLPQLEALFHGKVCGDEVSQGKPAPEIYQKAAALAGFAPAQCLGVEDSASGLESIRTAGACSVMIPDMLPYSPVVQPFTDHVLDSIQDLPGLIRSLNQQ